MLLKGVGENQDVFHVHAHMPFHDEVLEDVIHHGLECCWTVRNMTRG